MNDILYDVVRKARLEAEKEVVSENMMGVDFCALVCETKSSVRTMNLAEEYGKDEMEFKKGEW